MTGRPACYVDIADEALGKFRRVKGSDRYVVEVSLLWRINVPLDDSGIRR